jgi:hypothetical protein
VFLWLYELLEAYQNGKQVVAFNARVEADEYVENVVFAYSWHGKRKKYMTILFQNLRLME